MKRRNARILVGAVAGAVATVSMTTVLAACASAGLLGEPPPKKLTRRMLDAVGVRARGAPLGAATLAAHLGYGAAMGVVHGLLPRRPASTITGGAAFGLAVWAVSYIGWIPKVGLMPPPSRDRPGRPTSMILAHLVYGATLGLLRRERVVDRALRIAPAGEANVSPVAPHRQTAPLVSPA